MDWDTYLDNNLHDRAEEKFKQLPRFYKSSDGVRRYTNIEDAVDSIKQADWQIIANHLIAECREQAGAHLEACLMKICTSQAEEELEEEYEKNVASGKDREEELADMRYQRRRDAKLEA